MMLLHIHVSVVCIWLSQKCHNKIPVGSSTGQLELDACQTQNQCILESRNRETNLSITA